MMDCRTQSHQRSVRNTCPRASSHIAYPGIIISPVFFLSRSLLNHRRSLPPFLRLCRALLRHANRQRRVVLSVTACIFDFGCASNPYSHCRLPCLKLCCLCPMPTLGEKGKFFNLDFSHLRLSLPVARLWVTCLARLFARALTRAPATEPAV